MRKLAQSPILILFIWSMTAKGLPPFRFTDQVSLKLENLTASKDTKPPVTMDFSQIKKNTVVVFWASWCEYCKELGRNISSDVNHQRANFDFVSISVDTDRAAAQNAGRFTYGFLGSPYLFANQSSAAPEILPLVVILKPGGFIDSIYEGSKEDKVEYLRKRLRYLARLDGTRVDNESK